MIEIKHSPEPATIDEADLVTVQERTVAALRLADAMRLYDVAAHLDAAHQCIMDRMRQLGLSTSIIDVVPPIDDLA